MHDSFIFIAGYIVQSVLPFVDIFGIISNILCICINLSPRLRRAPTTLHLTMLAIYDLLFLISVIPVTFAGSGAESLVTTKLGCWITVFATFVTAYLSTWTVTAFSVERFIAVYFPLHRAAVCTFKNRVIIQLCLIPIPLLFNSYVFFLFPNEQGCYINEEHFLFIGLNVIDTVVANLIPLIAILTLNGLTAFRMWKYHQEREDNHELRLHHSAASGTRSNAVSRPLIIVSTVFAVLNVPYYVIRLKIYYIYAFDKEDDWTDFDEIFRFIAILLYHSNFAVNFLLYNFASKIFRKAVMDILSPNRLRQTCNNRLNRLLSSIYTSSTNV